MLCAPHFHVFFSALGIEQLASRMAQLLPKSPIPCKKAPLDTIPPRILWLIGRILPPRDKLNFASSAKFLYEAQIDFFRGDERALNWVVEKRSGSLPDKLKPLAASIRFLTLYLRKRDPVHSLDLSYLLGIISSPKAPICPGPEYRVFKLRVHESLFRDFCGRLRNVTIELFDQDSPKLLHIMEQTSLKTELVGLRLISCRLSSEELKCITRFSGLQELTFSASCVGDDVLEAIASSLGTQLRELTLYDCPRTEFRKLSFERS